MRQARTVIRSFDAATTGPPDRGERGVSLVELTVAVTILAFGALGASGLLLSSVQLEQTNRDATGAVEAVQSVVDHMQAVPFNFVFSSFNSDPADDAGGPGTAWGTTFVHVAGKNGKLRRLTDAGEADDGTVYKVKVRFPVDIAGRLVEGQPPLAPGMPTDLDGSGAVEGGRDVKASYRILPVKLTVSWVDGKSTRELDFFRLIASSSQTNERKKYQKFVTIDLSGVIPVVGGR